MKKRIMLWDNSWPLYNTEGRNLTHIPRGKSRVIFDVWVGSDNVRYKRMFKPEKPVTRKSQPWKLRSLRQRLMHPTPRRIFWKLKSIEAIVF